MVMLYASIFLVEFISFTYCVSAGHVSIYVSTARVQGRRDNLTGICNTTGLTTGLIKEEVVIDDSCTSRVEKAWIGAFAEYSPWVEYRGCGKFWRNAIPQNTTFTHKPNLSDCMKTCAKWTTFVSLSDVVCYCIYNVDFNLTSHCNDSHICKENIDLMCGDGYEKELVLYMINSTFTVRNETLAQCGIVNISNGKFEFGSQDCSANASALCIDNLNVTAYVNTSGNWTKIVQFCNQHGRVISYQDFIDNKTILSATHETYWISSFRDVSLYSFHDKNSTNQSLCVAAYVENSRKIRPEISRCDMELPVVCLTNTTDKNRKPDCSSPTTEDVNHTTDIDTQPNTSTTNTDLSYTTDSGTKPDFWATTIKDLIQTTDASAKLDFSSLSPKNSIKTEIDSGNVVLSFLEKNKIVLASIVGAVLFTVIVCLVVLIRCKFGKKDRTHEAPVNTTISYAEVLESQSQTDREMLVSEAQRQPDREKFHWDDDIYDHTDTSASHQNEDEVASKNYDTMENIKQETEGLYDHSINTCLRALESVTLEPEGLYDHV